jgi:hypothetical protein
MASESPVVAMPRASSILNALQAVKNIRAVILTALVLIVTAVVFGVVFYVAGRSGSVVLMFIGGLLSYLVGLYGVSAVGFMLMNDARGRPSLSITDALTVSLLSTHRWIAVMLSALVVFLLFVVVLALILFVCKIPFAGPVLYAVVLPVATFATALFLAAMYFVVIPLTFPAVWMGDTTMQVISKLMAIFRQRLVHVVVQVLLLVLLCLVVGGIIASLVFSALAIVGSLSAAILPGFGGGFGRYGMAGMMGGMMGGAGGGHMIAGMIGGGIVFAVVMIVPFLILFQGYCQIYLDAIEGMDFSAAESQLKSQMEAIQRKAREAQERVQEKIQSKPAAPAAAPQPAPPPAPPPAAPAPAATAAGVCPKCNGAVASDDTFCGSCGHKLH